MAEHDCEVLIERDVYVTMRDGVRIAVDIYRPQDSQNKKFPALLAMSPYSKAAQDVALYPKELGMNGELAGMEAGDSGFFVSRGYAHVIADVRGTCKSEGEYVNMFSEKEQQDAYDIVEWIADQPWCDGNVGMVGISYFAVIQYLVAAQQPPHLKAIFPFDGWGDLYRDITYHGGIPSVFACGLQKEIFAHTSRSVSRQMYSKEELDRRIKNLLDDEGTNYKRNPNIIGQLEAPDAFPIGFDYLMNRVDGSFYRERSPNSKMDKIKVPTYLGSTLHFYPVCMHLPGATTWGWDLINAPKKLLLFSEAKNGGQEDRPWTSRSMLEEVIRWFDHWLKGVENGIMDEPPVKIWVRGKGEPRYSDEWPLIKLTKWSKYYLHSNSMLTKDDDFSSNDSPEVFEYKVTLPIVYGSTPISPKPNFLSYSIGFDRDTEIIGPMSLELYASLSTDDADFIIVVKDVGPTGTFTTLTRGWLKASHRKLDSGRSKPWRPYHLHTDVDPVPLGQVNAYSIEIQPIANLFKKDHKLQLELWPCDWYDPAQPYDWTLFWGLVHHISYGKDTTYTIFHDQEHPSHLLVPEISSEQGGQFELWF